MPDSDAALLVRQAATLHRDGKLNEALACFDRATDLEPGLAAAWNGRAALLLESGRSQAALEVLTTAVTATGNDLSVLANLANLYERTGKPQAAISLCETILACQPEHALACSTMGVALLGTGEFRPALDYLRKAARTEPENPRTSLNLGEALMALDAFPAALDSYRQALALDSQLVAARIGEGTALAMLERFHEADAVFKAVANEFPAESFDCFRRMASSAGLRMPDGWQVRAIEVFLSRYWLKQQQCDWRKRDIYLSTLKSYADHLRETGAAAYDESLAFQTMAAPLNIRQRRSLLDAVASGVLSAGSSPARQRLTRVSGPLRLGFLSTGFRNHPSAQLHWRHFAGYDRRRFRVHAYSLLHDPASGHGRKVRESVDVFRDVSAATTEEAAWRIARDGIDILVDLSGYQDNARPGILAARPAPIQVSYHGSPVSLGKRLVDYRISDRIASPDESEFSEALVYLPVPHCMYNDAEPVASRPPSRSECGLPDDALVYCAFNSAFKIEPEIFSLWMRLLHDRPDSVLWLSDAGQATGDNLRREAFARGIAPERLVFAPRMERPEHLARHACADLFLDTFICNAHTTAADALWAGLPVLTCGGDTMASRFAAAQTIAAGLPELVVESSEDYLTMARQLSDSPARLAELHSRLRSRQRTSRLFATARRIEHLSAAFEMMWERYCRGEPVATFNIPEDQTRS